MKMKQEQEGGVLLMPYSSSKHRDNSGITLHSREI